MQYHILLLASLASTALAQTATSSAASSGYTCAAQNVLDACSSTEQAQVDSCQGNDWGCLCAAWTNLLTCYNNCPGDIERTSVQQSVTQYCAAASQYPSTTTAGPTTGTATFGTQASNTGAVTTGTGSTTSSASSVSSTAKPNSAAQMDVTSGMLALMIAGLGLIA